MQVVATRTSSRFIDDVPQRDSPHLILALRGASKEDHRLIKAEIIRLRRELEPYLILDCWLERMFGDEVLAPVDLGKNPIQLADLDQEAVATASTTVQASLKKMSRNAKREAKLRFEE